MDWSLEKIYSQQVRGKIPQRRHLHVLGEQDGNENTPQEQRQVEHTVDKIKDLIDDIDIDQSDPDQMKKLFNIISGFEGYRPIKRTLEGKGFNPIVLKKYSNEILSLIVDLPREEKQQFFEFLERGSDVQFPEAEYGNLYDILTDVAGVSRGVAEEIMKHTGQDAAKRGVGMGELALALLFGNVDAAGGVKSKAVAAAEKEAVPYSGKTMKVGGRSYDPEKRQAWLDGKAQLEAAKKFGIKGDLELNGKEFEIKGENASLGATSDAIQPTKTKPAALEYLQDKMGITVTGNGYDVGGKPAGSQLGHFPIAVSEAYKLASNEGEAQEFEQAFKDYLKQFGKFDDDVLNSSVYNTINLSNPGTIQRGIAVLNLYRYTKEEGFLYFMAHDVGAGGEGTGNYVFATGKTPEEIARKIYNNRKVKFEKVSYNGLRPRIGFLSTFVEDSEIVEKA